VETTPSAPDDGHERGIDPGALAYIRWMVNRPTDGLWALTWVVPSPVGRRSDASRAEPRLTARLTARERQVLALMAAGRSDRQIAVSLGISGRTVEAHARNIMGKVGASNRVSAVVQGLLSVDPLFLDRLSVHTAEADSAAPTSTGRAEKSTAPVAVGSPVRTG
jgi:DNA-binding CsgD family transcriptional regulator